MSATPAPNPALVKQFDSACMNAVQIGRRLGYDPNIYLGMRAEYGPVDAAIRLVDGMIHYGIDRLWQLNRLDLTLEAIIHDNPQFHPLFPPMTVDNSDVLLRKVGYIP